jgi:tripartite-type tricarboxylate transporter receptor subunit TctC
LIAGHVKLASLGTTPLIPHYKAGAVRLLAQSTQLRSRTLPDVPTYQEAGVKGLVIEQWLGAFVPTGTPPEIRARLNAAINRALADQAVRERLTQSAQDAVGGSSEAFSMIIREDFLKYGRLIKQLNITPE